MRSKQAKLPTLSSKTKLLSFDLESNGLHGQAFAVSAVVIDKDGKISNEFNARIEIAGQVDNWVQENVLPKIRDMQVTHGNYQAMCDAFWRWFVEAQSHCDYVIVSNGYPVEYRFLLDCQGIDIDERYWQHPFPIIDVTSLMLLQGESYKKDIKQQLKSQHNLELHNPRDDAVLAALMAFKTLKLSGRLS